MFQLIQDDDWGEFASFKQRQCILAVSRYPPTPQQFLYLRLLPQGQGLEGGRQKTEDGVDPGEKRLVQRTC